MPESLTPEARQAWIDANEKIRNELKPESIVTGHKRIGAVDGAWTLNWTIEYIRAWGENVEVVKAHPGDPPAQATEMFERTKKAFPWNTGDFILWASALAQFPPKE